MNSEKAGGVGSLFIAFLVLLTLLEIVFATTAFLDLGKGRAPLDFLELLDLVLLLTPDLLFFVFFLLFIVL